MKTRINKQGYVRITNDPTRTAWEHIRVAEAMLGRKLGITEQVHHIDGNKTNNDPSNLMVMRTSGDHRRMHTKNMEVEIFQTCDGSYIVVPKQIICKTCGRPFIPDKGGRQFCSVQCKPTTTAVLNTKTGNYTKILSRKVEKQVLLAEFNSQKSVCAIAAKYGVTDNAIRKWCAYYGISPKIKDYPDNPYNDKNKKHPTGKHPTDETKQKLKQAIAHAWEAGKMDSVKKPVVMYDKVTGDFCGRYASIVDAERSGFTGTKISACCRGKIPSHKGFIWRYEVQ